MKYLLLFLALAVIACAAVAITEAEPSGARQGAYAFAGVAALAVGYNKYRTGKWFADTSGGN